MKKLQTLKGFRDFYPEQMAFRNWLYRQLKSVAESFGFEEYDGPMIEPLELYAAKSASEEQVKKGTFSFKSKSGNFVTLRPEMTPTLARMVSRQTNNLHFPLRWFNFGPRFRYEAPQRGRGREFFQWDVDILGLEIPEADAEILTVAASACQALGFSPTEVRIRINDRQYLQQKLTEIGINPKKQIAVIRVIDKKDKVRPEVFKKLLSAENLTSDQVNGVGRILSMNDVEKSSPWLRRVMTLIKRSGVGDYFEFDPSIVRGLDYYTRTVFEGWDVKKKFRAIWGGGRYDNLTADIGGKVRIPGVGFAMGDIVIEELLRANGKYPVLQSNPLKILITSFDETLFEKSELIAKQLRNKGVPASVFLDSSVKLDRQLKYADRKRIPFVAIIGPDEAADNLISVKNLKTGEQKIVPLEKLAQMLHD